MATPKVDPNVNLRCSEAEVLMAVEYGLGRGEVANRMAAEMVLRLRRQLSMAAWDRIRAAADPLPEALRDRWTWMFIPPPPTEPRRVPEGPVVIRGYTAAITLRRSNRTDKYGMHLHWVRRPPGWPELRRQLTMCGRRDQLRPINYDDRPIQACSHCQNALLRALSAPAWPT